MRMKRLTKIGALLLFMIGFCIVQTGNSTPVLVDDDVGVEYTMDVSNDAVLTTNFEIQVPVEAPLQYPLINSELVILSYEDLGICFEALSDHQSMITQDICYMPGNLQNVNSTKKRKDHLSEQTMITMGLYRLDIGENPFQNPIC